MPAGKCLSKNRTGRDFSLPGPERMRLFLPDPFVKDRGQRFVDQSGYNTQHNAFQQVEGTGDQEQQLRSSSFHSLSTPATPAALMIPSISMWKAPM